MREILDYAKNGLFKPGMKLMFVGGAIALSPLVLALLSAMDSGDVNSGSAVIFLGILTFPAGGVTAIIGLAKLSGQPNSRVGRRLLFTLGGFFGIFFLLAGLGLISMGTNSASFFAQGLAVLGLSAFNITIMGLAFYSLFKREARA